MVAKSSIRWAVLLTALVVFPSLATATHYPDGSLCYDCHAVSKGKMVAGTHLIKASQRTTDLGIVAGSATMRCLFCHATDAVSAPLTPGRVMRPVDTHFSAASLSKHRASVQSTVLAQDPTQFDCKDCHVAGTANSVTSDANGNTFVHGRDAKTEQLNVYSETLIGAPSIGTAGVYVSPASLTSQQKQTLSSATCANAACHGATATVSFGNYTAPRRHGYAKGITLNDMAGSLPADPTAGCLGCHGTHNSVDGTSLLVLKNTSGANGAAAPNATVTPGECEVCHSQDENGGLTNNYAQYGHGKVGIGCSTCHEVSHVDVSGNWLSGSRLRPELAEDATGGTSTFGTSFSSNCKKCHSGHATHTPAAALGGFKGSVGYAVATGRSAGCRDCHDQHGTTAADATAQNDKMIRRSLGAYGLLPAEDTRLPLGRTSAYSQWFVFGQTYGACDNRSCHDKLQTAGPTATLATASAHLGGTLTATSCSNSAGCHTTHLTAPAPDQFGAAQDCDGCHAANGVGHTRTGASPGTHVAHVGSPYVSGTCNRCHPHNGPGSTGDTAHLNGTVDFGGTYMTAAFNYPVSGGSLPDASCATAANGCHNAPATSWVTTSLIQCQDCHAATGKLLDQGGWPVASNKHTQHLASNSLLQTGTSDCFACHDTTVDSAGALKSGGAHLNNQKDVAFNAAYGYEGVTATRTGTGAATTCANARCHNGVTTPSWAAASTIACGQCHNTGGTGPIPSGATVAGSHGRHASNAWPNTDCDNCHGDGANKPSANYTATGGGGGLHQNLAVDLYINNGAGTYTDANTKGGVNWSTGPDGVDNGTCATTNCHGGSTPTWGGVLVGGCFACHPGTGTEPLAKPVEAVGNGPNLVLQAQYGSTGHGNATTYSWDSVSGAAFSVGNAGTPNKGCYECHDPASKHTPAKNAADPYRLGATYAGNTDGLCSDCHGAVAANPKKALNPLNLNIVGHSKTTTASAKDWPPTGAVDYAYKCVDCHDPHGDANHFMVRDALSAPTAASDTTMGSNAYGTPLKADAAMSAVTFASLAGYAANSYAVSGAANGICEVCHNQTSYYRRGDAAAQSHNTATRCTDCHQHNGGFRAACSGCHGYPPPESPSTGTTVSWTSDKAVTPASVGDHGAHASGATPYAAGDCNATCHVTGTHAQNKSTANMGVKAATAAASTGVYQYSTLDNFDTWLGGAQTGNLSVVDDRCTNVSCHNATYGAPANVYKSPANPTYVRYWDKNLNCYSCHGYDGVTASAPRPTADAIASGSHTQHVATAGYALACTNCHPSAGYTTSHKSGIVNFATNLGATRIATVTGGVYDVDGVAPFATATPTPKENGNGYYCANAYCHSGGTVRGTAPTTTYANTTRWGTTASGACGTCHGVDGQTGTTAVMATNVHAKHTATGGYGYACTACHSGVVGGTRPSYTIASTALHVNGTNDVAFGANEGTYAAAAGGTVGPLGGSCTTTYCHSQGLDWTAPYTGSGTAALTTPDWDTPAGTITCGYCHGAPPSYANNTSIQPGATAYPKKNSHARHANYSCDRCHYGTTTTGTTITNPALHANKAYDLAANTGAGVSFTVTTQGGLAGDVYTPTSCGTISCHNGGSAQWGATLGCTDCHFRTTAQGGDLDNWNLADGTASAVNSEEWTYSGHGRTGTAYDVSGNPAAAFAGPAGDASGCGYCHDASVAHGTAANPFRLRNAGAVSGTANESQGWNDACLICHKTGQAAWGPAGYTAKTAASRVDKDHYGTKHSAATQGGAYCWDCHDPHGDRTVSGGNVFMVQRAVTKGSNGTTGIPATTVALTFTAATTGTDYAKSTTPFDGICNVCHTTANHYTATAGDGHNSATRCTNCHTHQGGFGASCNGCHGDIANGIRGDGTAYPPEGPVAARTAKAGALNWAEANATASTVGHHQVHVTSYGTTNCDTCHATSSGSDALHNTNKPNATMANLATYGTWAAGTAVGNFSVVDDNCTNVSCHNATYGTPANVYKSAANPTYVRYWDKNLNCYSCHGYDGVTASAPRPTADAIASGSHTQHVATAGYALACTNCHPSAGYTTSHKSGIVNFATNLGATRIATVTGGVYDVDGVAPFATATPTPKENGNGYYCANAYCHSGGTVRGTTPTTTYANTTKWGTAASGACGTCHGVDGQTGTAAVMSTNVHAKHTVTGGYGYACTACHSGVVAGARPTYTIASTALHLNGTNDVNFGTNEGTYAAAAGGTVGPLGGTCTVTYCHSQGLDWTAPYTGTGTAALTTPDWDTPAGTITCGYCHGNPPGYANNTAILGGAVQKKNSHAAHGGYSCDRCHYGTTTTGTTITNPALHANKVFDLAANTAAGVIFTVTTQGSLAADAYTPTTCGNISCHGGTGTSAQWGASLGCADCHLRTQANGGDLDDWTITNGTVALISSDEWAYSGHGKASGTYDGLTANPAAAFAGPAGDPQGCRYCHSASVLHGDATNPFRLANKNVLARATPSDGGWNDNCLVCHRTGDGGYVSGTGYVGGYNPGGGYATKNAISNVDENHYGAKHNATTDGGNFCWDCHDPHGDRLNSTTGNLVMVQRTVTKVSDGVTGLPTTAVATTFTANATGTDYAQNGATPTGVCNVCHTTTSHYTSTSGDSHESTKRCTDCHKHDKDFGAACVLCHGTDRVTAPTAPQVIWENGTATGRMTAYGSHVKAATADVLSGTTDWNVQCGKCHSGHSGPVTVPLPSTNYNTLSDGTGTTYNMQTQLGINYTTNGGIHLGGTATSGTTEADICWNCHGTADAINEWGYNAYTGASTLPIQFPDSDGGTGTTYNHGWLYNSSAFATLTGDWTNNDGGGAFRKDGYQHDAARLSRQVTSVHSANVDMTAPAADARVSSVGAAVNATTGVVTRGVATNLEKKAQIRCSYCHDVHDLNKATGDTTTGRPLLRGSWTGNPYPPDMPPRAGNVYPTTDGVAGTSPGPGSWGNRFVSNNGTGTAFSAATPRLYAYLPADKPTGAHALAMKGGFFIDQNAANPTGGMTLSATAGLCLLCHGTGATDAAKVDTMNYYTTTTKLWRSTSTNGHANSTLGGDGVGKTDLFDARRTGTIGNFMSQQDGVNTQNWGKPLSSSTAPWFTLYGSPQPCNSGGANCPPRNTGWYGGTLGATARGGDYTAWYSAGGIGGHTGTAGAKAHDFTCSKCHSPHATGLPALLITNCLDKTYADWTANSNRVGPNASSANFQNPTTNCHRKTSNADGWNRLAPGQ